MKNIDYSTTNKKLILKWNAFKEYIFLFSIIFRLKSHDRVLTKQNLCNITRREDGWKGDRFEGGCGVILTSILTSLYLFEINWKMLKKRYASLSNTKRGKRISLFYFFLYQAFTFQLLTLFIEGKTLFRVFYTYTLYGRGNKTTFFLLNTLCNRFKTLVLKIYDLDLVWQIYLILKFEDKILPLNTNF